MYYCKLINTQTSLLSIHASTTHVGEDLSDFNGQKIVTFRDLLSVNRHELQACFGEDRTTWMLQKAIGMYFYETIGRCNDKEV